MTAGISYKINLFQSPATFTDFPTLIIIYRDIDLGGILPFSLEMTGDMLCNVCEIKVMIYIVYNFHKFSMVDKSIKSLEIQSFNWVYPGNTNFQTAVSRNMKFHTFGDLYITKNAENFNLISLIAY